MVREIDELKSTTFSGRRLTRKQIADIRDTVAYLPKVSRNHLCRLICEDLDWVSAKGNLKIGACLKMLESLERHGVLTLPPKVAGKGGHARARPVQSSATDPQPAIEGALSELRPLRIERVDDSEGRQRVGDLIESHHYLGFKRPFGTHLLYLVRDRHERVLACLIFESSTPQLPCRDAWIGWSARRRARARHRVLCNSRFLILPWVTVHNLASAILGQALRQLPDDWQQIAGERPLLVETYVDTARFRASCYRAANWQAIGHTTKTSKKSLKTVFVHPLEATCKEQLRGDPPPPKPEPASKPSSARDARFVRLWEQINDITVAVANRHDGTWQKRRRVFNSLIIILFVFRLVIGERRAGYKLALNELWEQCQAANIPLPQPNPPAASSITEAREKLDETVFKTLHRAILEQHAKTTRSTQWKGHRIHAVDGSKISLPRQLLADGYKLPNPQTHYPQGLVSTLYRLHDRIPIDFELHNHGNEREAALDHFAHLSSGDVVVYDRGYYAYAFLHQHWLHNIECVFRIAKKANPDFDDFIASSETERTITLNAPKAAHEHRAHRIRLLKYTAGQTEFRLATTLLDETRYPAQALANLYHKRWEIEEFYKSAKSIIGRFHAQSLRGVKQELYAAFIIVALARLFTNHAETELNQQTPEQSPKTWSANFNNSARLVMKSLEVMLMRHCNAMRETLFATVHCIKGCAQRIRPNRSYPRYSRQPKNKWTKAKAQAKA